MMTTSSTCKQSGVRPAHDCTSSRLCSTRAGSLRQIKFSSCFGFFWIAEREPEITGTVRMAIFSINCTLPPEGTAFVHPPNARGTLDIVYSCAVVIVLCTWSVLHLNVPLQTTPTNKLQKLARSLSRTLTKLKWMVVNILAPEWPFAQAVCGLVSEYKLRGIFE